ncbi:MAG: hypothetical protein BRC32_05290 [Actinobacteria bacterium QS_8_72_14]|nr:MAG: hypothetical protein BRC32_05290 [Actinobacteria bacterium QS_8_72_14]
MSETTGPPQRRPHQAVGRVRVTASLWAVLALIAGALLVAAAAVLILTDGLAALRTDRPTVVGIEAERSPEEIRDFWTEERMREAEGIKMPSVDTSLSPAEVVLLGSLLTAGAGALAALWLAFRPLDSAAWGPEIGLGRLLLLLVTLPIALPVLVVRPIPQRPRSG